MGKLIEGRWDCSYCGTKGILGRNRECPNCGRPRGEDVKFYMSDSKDYVPDEEAKNISREPDWMCEYCGCYNSAKEHKCISCGAERELNNNTYFDIQKRNQERKKEKSQYKNEYTMTSELKNEEENSRDIEDRKSFVKKGFVAVGAIIGILIMILGIISVFTPKEASMKITEFSWQRNISIEEYKTFHESDWSVPSGGRVTGQSMEFHHYDSVIDHYETKTREVEKTRISGYETRTYTKDLGNGYFEEESEEVPVYETYYETEEYEEPVYIDEPVYRMKYYYDIDRWTYERSVKTKGNDKSPYWGKANLQDKERVRSETETYTIKGITDEKEAQTRKVNVDADVWKKLKMGQTVKIQIYVGGVTKLKE